MRAKMRSAEIAAQLPHLTVAQVEAALAYAASHPEEIEDDLARRERKVERLRRELGEAPVVEKLRRLLPGPIARELRVRAT